MSSATFVPLGALATLLLVGPALAQAPPATDIHLFRIEAGAAGWRLNDHTRVTDRAGYDNQPHFAGDGALLYTSARDGQTDIYRYDVQTRRHEVVLASPESEYSPTPLPDGSGVSVVRVEADGTQRLWKLLATGEATLLLPDVEPVGYHAWIDATRLALFVLGEPPTLQLAEVGPGPGRVVAREIGRSLHRLPQREAVSFVDRSQQPWTIRELDPASGEQRAIADCVEGAEDYAWTPGGGLLMAGGDTLYGRPAGAGEWRSLGSFAELGLGEITRIAVSPDGTRLALVAARSAPQP